MTPEDLTLLAGFRQQYTPALTAALQNLVAEFPEPEVALSARIKNSATILDKLRREPRMQLDRMQDIAGIRLVSAVGGRRQQNTIVQRILDLGIFEATKTIDRVASPRSGYRALHVHGTFESHRMELQIRTQLQHDWAQFFERLADLYGRQIRYGEPPSVGQGPLIDRVSLSREDVIARAMELAERIDEAERDGSAEREEEVLAELGEFRDVLVPQDGVAHPDGPLPEPVKDSVLYLVVYDRCKSTTLRWATGTPEALQPVWTELEQQHGGDDNIEIVLLASSSRETLRKTHARYFTSAPGV